MRQQKRNGYMTLSKIESPLILLIDQPQLPLLMIIHRDLPILLHLLLPRPRQLRIPLIQAHAPPALPIQHLVRLARQLTQLNARREDEFERRVEEREEDGAENLAHERQAGHAIELAQLAQLEAELGLEPLLRRLLHAVVELRVEEAVHVAEQVDALLQVRHQARTDGVPLHLLVVFVLPVDRFAVAAGGARVRGPREHADEHVEVIGVIVLRIRDVDREFAIYGLAAVGVGCATDLYGAGFAGRPCTSGGGRGAEGHDSL